MNTRDKLIHLALQNLDQIPSAKERIELLNEASQLADCDRRRERIRVASNCLHEAEEAQLELIKEFSN